MSEDMPKWMSEMFQDTELIDEIIQEIERSEPETLETSVEKTELLNFWHNQKKYIENK